MNSAWINKVPRLARAVKPVYRRHRREIEVKKHGGTHWRSPDFIWEALILSFSTWGNAQGSELFTNSELHDHVRYAHLRGLPTDEARETELRDCLTKGHVRWVARKTALLMDNFRRIEKDGGPETVKRELSSRAGSAAKVEFLRSFRGIGQAYARNMMMDVYHEDFHNCIKIDARLKKVMNALELTFDERKFSDAEEFFLKAARRAGLNGWEMDRLIFTYLDEVLAELQESN
jgi:hypothetical protein